ncbi:helix-turn-helix transcriptional regulator [Mesorhizobium sp. M0991]|uniref:helix-turn-helix transcriptional regulator n=1 Tax=Mesorhizobium sp. M0991 TaxID=2957043 RepID=UPI003337A767
MGAAFDFDAIGNVFAEAAVDPSRWDAAMDVAEKATGSAGALLFDMRGHLPLVPCSRSMAPVLETYVRDGWINRDERYRGLNILDRQGVTSEFDLFTTDEIAKHPYYQEFLAPFGLQRYAAVKVAAADEFWVLSLQRSIQQGPFTPDEMRQLAELSKQLGSAAAVARAIGFARVDAALDAFSATETPAIMLDRSGNVLTSNPSAERLLGRDLQITRRRLVSFERTATDALDRSLRALLCSPDTAASMPPVPLPRLEGRPLLAYPLRLPKVSYNALAPCQAVVVPVDPDARPPPPEAVLQSCFSLTMSEARLARKICSGQGVEAAADELGVSYETARNQLKSVFAKTQTHRQSELATLLTRLSNGR